MSFSDSDWTRDPPRRPRMPASQRRVLILTIAIAVSCMALAIAVYGIEQLLDASSRSEAFKRIGDMAAMSPPGAGVVAPPAVASAVEASPTMAAAATSSPVTAAASASDTPAAVDAQQLFALEREMRLRARETAEQAAVEAARRKERTWQRFYQRPDFCADNPTAAQMVQCANQYIRARKEFEERYSAGRL